MARTEPDCPSNGDLTRIDRQIIAQGNHTEVVKISPNAWTSGEKLSQLVQTSRRSDAQRESSYRLDSWVLRRTLDTCVSTVFTEMKSSAAISL